VTLYGALALVLSLGACAFLSGVPVEVWNASDRPIALQVVSEAGDGGEPIVLYSGPLAPEGRGEFGFEPTRSWQILLDGAFVYDAVHWERYRGPLVIEVRPDGTANVIERERCPDLSECR
jgi:hypothetical protein